MFVAYETHVRASDLVTHIRACVHRTRFHPVQKPAPDANPQQGVFRPLEWLELRTVGTRTAHDHRLTRTHFPLFFFLRMERKWHGVSKSWFQKLGRNKKVCVLYALSVSSPTQRKMQAAGECLLIQELFF
jgi:hypothetical protein